MIYLIIKMHVFYVHNAFQWWVSYRIKALHSLHGVTLLSLMIETSNKIICTYLKKDLRFFYQLEIESPKFPWDSHDYNIILCWWIEIPSTNDIIIRCILFRKNRSVISNHTLYLISMSCCVNCSTRNLLHLVSGRTTNLTYFFKILKSDAL